MNRVEKIKFWFYFRLVVRNQHRIKIIQAKVVYISANKQFNKCVFVCLATDFCQQFKYPHCSAVPSPPHEKYGKRNLFNFRCNLQINLYPLSAGWFSNPFDGNKVILMTLRFCDPDLWKQRLKR